MSQRAISIAHLRPLFPGAQASRSATIRGIEKGSFPWTSAARLWAIAISLATVSPMTDVNGDASPRPVTPSAVRSLTRTFSDSSGEARAVFTTRFAGMGKGPTSNDAMRTRARAPPSSPPPRGAGRAQEPRPEAVARPAVLRRKAPLVTVAPSPRSSLPSGAAGLRRRQVSGGFAAGTTGSSRYDARDSSWKTV